MNLEIYGTSKSHFSAHGELVQEADTIEKRLLPCPFCGSDVITVSNTHTPYYDAECQDCGAQGPPGRPTTKGGDGHIRTKKLCQTLHREAFEDAIFAWNART